MNAELAEARQGRGALKTDDMSRKSYRDDPSRRLSRLHAKSGKPILDTPPPFFFFPGEVFCCFFSYLFLM